MATLTNTMLYEMRPWSLVKGQLVLKSFFIEHTSAVGSLLQASILTQTLSDPEVENNNRFPEELLHGVNLD